MSDLDQLIAKLERFIDKIDPLIPNVVTDTDFQSFIAFKWIASSFGHAGHIQPIHSISAMTFADLVGIDDKAEIIKNNTIQFIKGFPANNVLLTGSRGTGKSSLIKACLTEFKNTPLKIIEIDKENISDLNHIVFKIVNLPYKFIIYCDDLSFDANDNGYKSLKTLLEGSLMEPPKNILFYATSNRRHLIQEYMSDNTSVYHSSQEIHTSDAIEEKISLSERFGIWISFYSLSQDEYLNIVQKHLLIHHIENFDENLRKSALQYSLNRGSRSGRIAEQFVKQIVGQLMLRKHH